MSSDLRELFDRDVDFEPPHDLAERAVHGARTRRRNRFVVGGAVLATVVVVLGVVIGSGQVRNDSEPRPTDVAALPNVLPSADSVADLEAGTVQRASAAYVSDGMVVFVDAATGAPYRRGFGPPPVQGNGTFDVLVPLRDVALSPDGTKAVVLVDAWGRSIRGPTVRVLDLASNAETVVTDVTPAEDARARTLARKQVIAWENDSQHFVCSCAVDGRIPQLVRVARDGTWEPIDSDMSPVQVAAGSAGVAAQPASGHHDFDVLYYGGGPWVSVSNLAPAIPPSYAAALGRGGDHTYIAFRGSGFTLGEVGGAELSGGLLPSAGVDSQYVIATDVDAVLGGFVAVVAVAEWSEDPPNHADAVVSSKAVFIRNDGAYQEFMSLPTGTVAASFAGDLVAP